MACAHASSYAHAPGPLCYLCRIGLQVESHVRTKTSRPVCRECRRNTLLYAWKMHENICDRILAVLAVSCHKCSHSHQQHFHSWACSSLFAPPLSLHAATRRRNSPKCMPRKATGRFLTTPSVAFDRQPPPPQSPLLFSASLTWQVCFYACEFVHNAQLLGHDSLCR